MAEEKEKPLTREDVLRLIEENGGKAEGLDLSEQTFVGAIDLSDLDLHGIILKDARFPTHFEGCQLVGAKFDGSNLNRADLRSINLQYAQFRMLNNQPTYLQAADLRGSLLLNTNFQGADLTGAEFGDLAKAGGYPAAMLDYTDLRGAKLFRANFKGCYFYGTKLEGAIIRGTDILDANLEEADWGSYKIGDEKGGDFYSAIHYYRRLRTWYTNAGMYDVAGKFFYREMEARRKSRRWKAEPHLKLWDWILRLLCGYGEAWWRVIIWAIVAVFGLALIYFAIGTLTPNTFLNSLYYSTVSFTALGYGSWAPQPTGWVKGLGAFEAFVGVFTMALFLVTFTRKMTR
ncbi:MAG: pentapeptide repeat-containing protein [Chloroflexota bacterium]|nr:pentapeptide repeat-containing protein [Chloroflexota bacterium]